uniref:Uncharacterized protein n=1 Tax=Quercus lobata TaxID=97700 RepID=A0A7N2LXW8_QUELO
MHEIHSYETHLRNNKGNQAIREIQLNDDDCSYDYDGSFHLGIAVLVAAAFFGYMLALLQQRVRAMFSSKDQHIQQQPQQQQQHHYRHFSSSPQTYYEKSCETNEIVFGAVQEQDGRREFY